MVAITSTDYLIPHVNDNKREPLWDGDEEDKDVRYTTMPYYNLR